MEDTEEEYRNNTIIFNENSFQSSSYDSDLVIENVQSLSIYFSILVPFFLKEGIRNDSTVVLFHESHSLLHFLLQNPLVPEITKRNRTYVKQSYVFVMICHINC